jgi:hypothetical protein
VELGRHSLCLTGMAETTEPDRDDWLMSLVEDADDLDMVERVLRTVSGEVHSNPELDERLCEGADALFENDLDAALAAATAAVEIESSSAEAYQLLASVRRARKEWEELLDVCCDWAANAGTSAGQLTLLAQAAFRQGSQRLLLEALEGMCSVEVADVEFSRAQAMAADLGVSSVVGTTASPAELTVAAASSGGEQGCTAAEAAAGEIGFDRMILAEDEAHLCAVYNAWCRLVDGGSPVTEREKHYLSAVESSASQDAPESDHESLRLGLAAAWLYASGSPALLRTLWDRATANGWYTVPEGESMVTRKSGERDADATCARLVLLASKGEPCKGLPSDFFSWLDDHCDPIVWKHCRGFLMPVEVGTGLDN